MQKIILYNSSCKFGSNNRWVTSYKEVPIYQLSDQEVDFLNNIILNNTIDHEPKSLYFIPGTKLKREFVRNNLDSVKCVRNPEKADYIVYSIKDVKVDNIYSKTCRDDPTKETIGYYCWSNTNNTYEHATQNKRFPSTFEIIQKYPHKCITTENLYKYISSQNTIEVTPKFIDTIWQQIASTDNAISKIGVEALLSLDQNLYQDVIFFMLVLTYSHRQRNYNSDIVDNFCLFKKNQWGVYLNETTSITYLTNYFRNLRRYLKSFDITIKNHDLVRYIHQKQITPMGVTEETPFGIFRLQPAIEET